MIKDFQILSKLGEGAYSAVYKVRRVTDGEEYALKRVKLLNQNEKEKDNAINEIRILASVRHPNVVCYKEAFWEKNSSSLCIIMEYADDGDQFQKISAHKKKGVYIDEKEVWSIMTQCIKGLKALHDLKIFHRDLKSANVFLSKDGCVKIGDMNVSKVAKKGLQYTQTGTPYYASPEVWNDKPYDMKSDIWSIGCVVYEMAAQKPPFRAEDMDGLYKKVIKGNFQKLPSHYSVDLNNIVKMLLKVNPQLRPNCDKVLSSPPVIRRIEEKHCQESDEDLVPELLGTIKIPANFHYLTDKLPKANYNPILTRNSCKADMMKKDLNRDEKMEMSHDESMDSSMIKKSERDRDRDRNSNLPQIKGSRPQGSPIRGSRLRENELLKRQHQKIEAQLKKYNEILNNQKIKKDQNLKKKIEVLLNNGGGGNNKNPTNQGSPTGKNDFMKIYGVGQSSPKPKIDNIKMPQQGQKVGKLPQLSNVGVKKNSAPGKNQNQPRIY